MNLDFFNLHPPAFGLDISDFSVKIVRLKSLRGAMRLASFGEAALAPGVVTNGEVQKPSDLATAITQLTKSLQGEPLDLQRAIVSLPEEKAFLQVIQLPVMEQEQIQDAVRFEAENYIPFSLETVYLDSQVIAPLKNHLDHTDVLLASLPRDTVDGYLEALRAAQITPLAFEVESLSVARSLVPNEVAPTPQLLIDLGANRTSFVIVVGSSVRFTTSIPVSSQQLTEHIATTLQIKEEQAENLKRHYGIAGVADPEGKEIFDALSSPLKELAEQIQKYIVYYSSHAEHHHLPKAHRSIGTVALCGGGANLPGLPAFLQAELGVQVKMGNPWVNILPPPVREVPGLPFKDSLRYTTALGLALRGVRGNV